MDGASAARIWEDAVGADDGRRRMAAWRHDARMGDGHGGVGHGAGVAFGRQLPHSARHERSPLHADPAAPGDRRGRDQKGDVAVWRHWDNGRPAR